MNASIERDDARRRLRRATSITLAGAGVLVAAFAGLAAKALPGKHTATTTTTSTTAASNATSATPPPLVPVESAATPSAPAATPQQTQSPPVAVSGGS